MDASGIGTETGGADWPTSHVQISTIGTQSWPATKSATQRTAKPLGPRVGRSSSFGSVRWKPPIWASAWRRSSKAPEAVAASLIGSLNDCAKLCKRSRNRGYVCNVRNNRTNKLRVFSEDLKVNSPRLHHNRIHYFTSLRNNELIQIDPRDYHTVIGDRVGGPCHEAPLRFLFRTLDGCI